MKVKAAMLHFQLFDLIRWLHFSCVSVAGGASVVALLISGLEEDREDLRGLSALLWKRVVAWGFRLGASTGGVLLALGRKAHPFDDHFLYVKLVLVFLLLVMSELSPKALAQTKRGAPLLTLLMFLLTTFVVINGKAFGHKPRPFAPPAEASAGPAS